MEVRPDGIAPRRLILAVSDPSHPNDSNTHSHTDMLQSSVATVTAASTSNGSLCSRECFRGAASKSRPKQPFALTFLHRAHSSIQQEEANSGFI